MHSAIKMQNSITDQFKFAKSENLKKARAKTKQKCALAAKQMRRRLKSSLRKMMKQKRWNFRAVGRDRISLKMDRHAFR